MKNPTPFPFSSESGWIDCGPKNGPTEYRLLPARVYLVEGRTPKIVVSREQRRTSKKTSFLVGESPSSGFSGLMFDEDGNYSGSIRRAIKKDVS